MTNLLQHISNDVIRGIFDSDGNIYPQLRKRQGKNGTFVSIHWTFSLEVATFNKELASLTSSYLGTKQPSTRTRVRKNNKSFSYTRLVLSPNSKEGQKFIQIYDKDPPLVDNRYKQFMVFKEVYANQALGNKKSNVDRARNFILLKSIASTQQRLDTIDKYLNDLSFSKSEIQQATQEANNFILNMDQNLLKISQTLPKKKLSNDYMIGFHYGDGSINMVYSFESTSNKLRFIPQWSITEPYTPLLEAFKNTLGQGRIHTVGTSKITQFVLSGKENCKKIMFPIFDTIQMPSYKQQQYDKFKQGIFLLENKKPNENYQYFNDFIDLTYQMSHQNRSKPKDYFLKFGEDFFNKDKMP